jgi:prepilin-type N-terminal cleavage/methylation domain-containing protein
MKTNLVKNVKAGFSLVEMLVVIAVIGIIAAIAVPTIGNITSQANSSKAKRNAQSLASVCASAVAAGATFESTSVADIVDDLVDSGVFGSADSGFDTTLFKVPNVSEIEKTNAAQHLSYDTYAKMIIYAPSSH